MFFRKFFIPRREYQAEILALKREIEKLRQKLSQKGKEEQSKLTIVGLQDGVIRLDEENKVEYINSTIQKIFKVNKEEVLGKTLAKLSAIPWSRWLLPHMVLEAKETRRTVTREESFTSAEGKEFHFNIKVSVIERKTHILLEDITEQKKIELSFKRYVSPYVVEQMKSSGKDFFRSHRAEITILFADLRGFTKLSDQLEPNEIRRLLNDYFSWMVEIIYKYEATLDKFLGDGVMVLFGAPIYFPEHAVRALKVAVEFQVGQEKFKEKLPKTALPIGIGISTGEVVIGNIGSERRTEYTAIGYPVNIASRLCDLAQGNEILVSEETYQSFLKSSGESEIKFEPASVVEIKGLSQPLKVYRVIL
jgi:adenylate cyclase